MRVNEQREFTLTYGEERSDEPLVRNYEDIYGEDPELVEGDVPIMRNFSIIIPVYNEEKLLASALTRLIARLDKTHRGLYEIILSENGSTDNTLKLARRLARRYPFIRVIHSQLPSYGQAFRRGIYEAYYDTIVQFDLDFWDVRFLNRAI